MEIEKIKSEIDSLKDNDFSLLDSSHGFVVDGLIGGFKASIDKMKYSFNRQILLGIFAGIILAVGYVACISATYGLKGDLAGLSTLIMGVLFPGCIILISFLGGGLYTSHVVATLPTMKKTVKLSHYFRGIFGVLIGNFIGTLIGALLLGLMGMYSYNQGFANAIHTTAMHKMLWLGDHLANKTVTIKDYLLTFIGVFSAGILCNFLVASTLPITFSTKNTSAAITVMFFAIAFFVISGFQHSAANTFFFWVLLVENFWKTTDINYTYFLIFLVFNFIPAALGNFVGGALLMPGLLYLINIKYCIVLFQKQRLILLENILKNRETE